MNLEDLKRDIEQRTGVPAALLTGETVEENIAQAKALLAYRRENEATRPKTTAEQFADWLRAQEGIEEQDAAGAALADLEATARRAAGGYPELQDGGELDHRTIPDGRSAAEQFAEWFNKTAAIDTAKDPEGWKRFY